MNIVTKDLIDQALAYEFTSPSIPPGAEISLAGRSRGISIATIKFQTPHLDTTTTSGSHLVGICILFQNPKRWRCHTHRTMILVRPPPATYAPPPALSEALFSQSKLFFQRYAISQSISQFNCRQCYLDAVPRGGWCSQR